MNNLKYLLTLVLCGCFTIAFAQVRISGHVWSKGEGGLVMANVVEKDANNRNITATQTDANGNFSMMIKNPSNRLQVSYIGYVTKTLPIGNQRVFKVELVDRNTLKSAVIVGKKQVKSNGLTIPEREISVAQQSLNMDQMEGLSFETAGEALQGQIAGLDIIANSGNLGAGTSMRLRGVSSINGSQEPLIVVNGNIMEDYNKRDIDFTNLENQEQFATLLQVSPEDIQTIKVLKDAAATAIWGARGSNGVIEITTRRGARGKTKVRMGYRFNGSWQPSGLKMLSGDDYTMMLKEAYFNPTQSDVASSIVELMYLQSYTSYYDNYNKNTDWFKEVTQFGQSHNMDLSISGGGDKATFRVSGTYSHETGTIIKQALDRFTSRLTLDYWVSDRIKFSSDFSLTYTNNKKNYNDGILASAYKAMPNMTVYRNEYRETADGLGEYFNTGEYYIMPPAAPAQGLVANNSGYSSYYLKDMVENGNPVATANMAWRKTSSYTISPQFSLEYKLLGKADDETQLNYDGEVYLNAFTESNESYYPHYLTSKSWEQGVDLTSNNDFKNFTFTTRHSLVFKPYFYNDKHSLQMMARYELSTNTSTSQSVSNSGINGGITDPTVNGYLTGSSTSTGNGHRLSGITSFHYSYGSKYSFDLTVRADGSTKFGSGRKWGFFPGVSGRWNISDEKFFHPLKKVLNLLSFRAGWGITGNQPWQEGLMYNKYAARGSYNGTQAIVPTNLRLTEIRWEKSNSWNWGFNLGVLNDLLTFDLNIYTKKTSDLLNSGVRIPSSTGYRTLDWANVGKMKNEGWELFMNTHDLLKHESKFNFKLRFNIAQNINTIREMEASVLASNNTDFNYQNEQILRRVQIGNALGGIYGFRFKGVYAYDYDHNGYFLDQRKNNYRDANGQINTAKETGKTAPIAHDAMGNIIYDKNGNPLPMIFNYGGIDYQFQGGDVIYEDINHDGQINELDIVYLGGSNPKVNGGFGIDFSYGNWQLKTNFNFRIGNKILNMARMKAEDMLTNNNQMRSVNHRWRKNGQVTEIPRAMNASVGRSYNALVNDRYVEKGDFLRFQYVQLSYRIPAEKLKKYGLSSLAISASGNNLIFWTKYKGVDPEHGANGFSPSVDWSQTPRSRSFTFSLNFGF